jgi:hypothetical protein
MRAVRQLPFSVEPVVEDKITGMRCRLRYGPKIERKSRRVLCLMTQRRLLDAFLLGDVSHPGEAQGAGERAMQVIDGLARLARNPRTSMA